MRVLGSRGTHMRVRVVGRGRTGAHLEAGDVARVVHVGRESVLVAGELALDGLAEVGHGRERDGHGAGEVLWLVGFCRHGAVGLGGAVGHEELLGRRRVGRVGEHGGRVGPLPVVVGLGEEVLVVIVHGRRELALGHGLRRGDGSLLLGRLRGRLLAGVLGGGLLVAGGSSVRGAGAPLEVLQAPLELLACRKKIGLSGGVPRRADALQGSYVR